MSPAHLSIDAPRRGVPTRSLALRVLIVDDNVDGAEALCAVLAAMGCTTAAAFDGAQGLATAAAFEPHLALIDLEMPGMSGCEVAQQLKASGGGTPARLVCLTGRGQPEDRLLCINAGFDDFFTKPVRPESLIELVASTNAGRASHWAGASPGTRRRPSRPAAWRRA